MDTYQVLTSHLFVAVPCCVGHEKRLGDYDTHQFSDKRVQEPLAKYQEAIEDIETEMIDE